MKRIALAALVCLALSSCATQPASKAASTSPTATKKPTAAQKPATRDWVSELVAIGYIPGADGGEWLDDRMKDDAQPFCNASLTTYGKSATARLDGQTEFESAVLMNSRAADPEMELGYFLKVLERYCPERISSFDVVLKLHPEFGSPKGRDERP